MTTFPERFRKRGEENVGTLGEENVGTLGWLEFALRVCSNGFVFFDLERNDDEDGTSGSVCA